MNPVRKPLGIKAYGHIPHLPGSRMGPGDHRCDKGQARIATEKLRDRHDVVIVQEKLDGSCVAVARIDGSVLPLGRAGYPAITSPYEQHRHFANWVYANQDRFLNVLHDGERVCGEWLMQAHGTRYVCREPFVAFDILRGPLRLPYSDFHSRIAGVFSEPHVISVGPPLAIAEVLRRLGVFGFHGALDPVEGAVWRVERKGAVDFLAKYVRADKVDGFYLPEVSGREPLWNWKPM